MKPPPSAEWDFRCLIEEAPQWQVMQCYQWEYHREVYKRCPPFQKIVNAWRTAPDPLGITFFEDKDIWFVEYPDWPEKPYLGTNIRQSESDFRSEVTEPEMRRWRQQGAGLQIDLREFVADLQAAPPIEDAWEQWPEGTVLTSNYEAIIALRIDWARPLDDIKKQVGEWLSWAHKHVANSPKKVSQGKAHPLVQARTRLKELTAMRLLAGRRRWKEATEIYGDEDLYNDQAGWTNAGISAQTHIKTLSAEWEKVVPWWEGVS